MNWTFADRVERVEPSATLAISNAAAELEADGIDVVDLSVGEPDFPTPENVVEAGKRAIDEGYTGYAPSDGIPELKEAIAEKFDDDGLDYATDEIIVTPGGKQALFETFMALLDEGDEVVLLDPAWVSYEAMAKMAGADIERVDLSPHEFQLEPALDELAATVSDDTDFLVTNSPSNPSGAVFSDAALEGVRDLAVDHDFAALADEIYQRIAYTDETPTSLGSLDGMDDRTVTLNGFSKAYSMTGWRLGYVGMPRPLREQASKIQSHSVSCATHFVQRAGVEALRNTEHAVAEMRSAFRERRDMLLDLFADHGKEVPFPDGAFYMMLPVDEDDQAWCEGAIEEAHVATVPGSAFGTPGYARLSYAASEQRLREGVDRLVEHGYL
ncbi:aspartate aminotransferase [Halobacteriales archaeon QS_9_67_17]|nr:MAG: aspartate aminotransferase [Halobacteriales archaeon QS_9_67_17]